MRFRERNLSRIILKKISFCMLLLPILAFAYKDFKGEQMPKPQFNPYTFTGYYIGMNTGWKWATYSTSIDTASFSSAGIVTAPQAFKFDTNDDSFAFGGQFGYAYQAEHFLFGVEFDYTKMSLGDTQIVPITLVSPVFISGDSIATSSSWATSYRLRLGYVLNNWLFYSTTGLSKANFKIKTNLISPDPDSSSFINSDSETLSGGTIGIGTEYAINEYWSIGVEYRYTKYSGKNFDLENLTIVDATSIDTSVTAKVEGFSTNQILAKVNFRITA